MTRQEYIAFINAFENLNPYELDHFCKNFYKHYQIAMQEREQPKTVTIGHSDVKEILLDAMKAVQIELAERKVEEAQTNLATIKAKLLDN